MKASHESAEKLSVIEVPARAQARSMETTIHATRTRPASVLLKVAMAVTGFVMAVWLTLHMLGNLSMFGGPELMNGYALKLRATGLLWPMRLGLVAALGVHVVCAVLTTRQGLAARPTRYTVALRHRATTWAARTMRWSGALLLLYLGYHVAQLYGVGHPSYVEGDVYHNLVRVLVQPLHAAIYLLATALFTLHLAHGLGSALISLGMFTRKRERVVQRGLNVWAWLVTAGFAVETLTPLLAAVG
jgi:succinate dehydrogenase / fumarate reductase cytochrome b subunit